MFLVLLPATTDMGEILNAGNGQSESVTFTPTDTTNYASISTTVTVNVAQSQATLTKTVNAVNITYGHLGQQLTHFGTSSVPGSYIYVRPTQAKSLTPVMAKPKTPSSTPTDTVNYQIISTTVLVNVVFPYSPTITATNEFKIYDGGHRYAGGGDSDSVRFYRALIQFPVWQMFTPMPTPGSR